MHKLLIDENTLYVGGAIPYYLTALELESAPRPHDPYYNLICFDIETSYYPLLVPTWKPKTNGPVFDIAIHNGSDGTRFLYCYGDFDEINGVNVSFVGAVPRNAATFSRRVPRQSNLRMRCSSVARNRVW